MQLTNGVDIVQNYGCQYPQVGCPSHNCGQGLNPAGESARWCVVTEPNCATARGPPIGPRYYNWHIKKTKCIGADPDKPMFQPYLCEKYFPAVFLSKDQAVSKGVSRVMLCKGDISPSAGRHPVFTSNNGWNHNQEINPREDTIRNDCAASWATCVVNDGSDGHGVEELVMEGDVTRQAEMDADKSLQFCRSGCQKSIDCKGSTQYCWHGKNLVDCECHARMHGQYCYDSTVDYEKQSGRMQMLIGLSYLVTPFPYMCMAWKVWDPHFKDMNHRKPLEDAAQAYAAPISHSAPTRNPPLVFEDFIRKDYSVVDGGDFVTGTLPKGTPLVLGSGNFVTRPGVVEAVASAPAVYKVVNGVTYPDIIKEAVAANAGTDMSYFPALGGPVPNHKSSDPLRKYFGFKTNQLEEGVEGAKQTPQ